MKKIKNMTAILLISLLISGCQLAVSPSGSGSGVLCGALVSWQDISSLDGQTSLSQNTEKILEGAIAQTGEKNSQGNAVTRVFFPGIDGFEFILQTVTEPEPITGEDIAVTENIGSPDFTDIQYTVRTDEQEEETSVSARLMVPADFDRIFYLYPIYEREDGTYYLIPEPAAVSASEGLGDATLSQSFSETLTVSEPEKENRSIVSISVSITGTEGADTLYLKEFSSDDRLLAAKEISPASYLDYPVSPETAYVIAERHLADGKILRDALNLFDLYGEETEYTCYFSDSPDALLPVRIKLICHRP